MEYSYSHSFLLQDATSYTVPHEFNDELKIIPECTYRVEVIAGPNDARFHPEINYTVPCKSDFL